MLQVAGGSALSSHTVEFGLSPFPNESKNILFELRLLLIPLLSQKDEISNFHNCHCQLQTPKFWCSETVSPFGSSKGPPSRMRTQPVTMSLMQTSCTDVNGLFLKFPKWQAESCDRFFCFKTSKIHRMLQQKHNIRNYTCCNYICVLQGSIQSICTAYTAEFAFYPSF